MKDCDSGDVNIKKIDEEINCGFTNQVRGEKLIKAGFKVKYFNNCWNLICKSGTHICKLDTTGTKRDALDEALSYIKVKKI